MSQPKKRKLEEQPNISEENISFEPQCKHYVKRKKRFCKMTVTKGKEYCGEHDLPTNDNRMKCPLDPKHTVDAKRLSKHLKICNAKPKDNVPDFIVKGINLGSDDEEEEIDVSNLKISSLEESYLKTIVDKVKSLYIKYKIEESIESLFASHECLKEELTNPEYGPSTIKHLTQSSAILGILDQYKYLNTETCFIEFGAGKGQVSYWLAKASMKYGFSVNSQVLLIDRASHRHKQDNRIVERDIVRRVRADIADFKISKLDGIEKCKKIIGLGKHLCGAATDFSLRCIVAGNSVENNPIKTEALLIALCCHHQSNWKSFVGKRFFRENEIDRKAFHVIIRMVSWAICGSGLSREKQKEIEESPTKEKVTEPTNSFFTREEKEEIGYMCKRVIDYARIQYLEQNGFKCSFKYYVSKDITLENVCLFAELQK